MEEKLTSAPTELPPTVVAFGDVPCLPPPPTPLCVGEKGPSQHKVSSFIPHPLLIYSNLLTFAHPEKGVLYPSIAVLCEGLWSSSLGYLGSPGGERAWVWPCWRLILLFLFLCVFVFVSFGTC